MSITITAQAIPSVASGDWDVIDERLLRRGGDWPFLRTGLIHAVCDRLTREGDPVSRLEELLLGELYRQPNVSAGFREALASVREDLASWPQFPKELVEHLLAQYPDFPAGFERMLAEARAGFGVDVPARGLGRFRRRPTGPGFDGRGEGR